MEIKITIVLCLCDDLLKALNHHQDPQCLMSDAEVMTTAIVSALYFGGNYSQGRSFLQEHGYIPKMLGKSRFSRRLNRISSLFGTLFTLLGETFKELNEDSVYAIDTFPVAALDNYRIPRAKLYQQEAFRGYQLSKKRYFFGIKIHLMVTLKGQPVEFFFTPGSVADATGLYLFDFDLPEHSWVVADKAYNNYHFEDLLDDFAIELKPIRKCNSKRQQPPWVSYLQNSYRRAIETTGSLIQRLLPKSIHAVTAQGFELKVVLFILACSFNFL